MVMKALDLWKRISQFAVLWNNQANFFFVRKIFNEVIYKSTNLHFWNSELRLNVLK